MATYTTGDINSISGSGIPSSLFMVDMQDWYKYVQLDSTPVLDKIDKSGAAPSVPMDKATWGWSVNKPTADTLGASIADTSTTSVTVTTAGIWQIGEVIKFTSGELAKITNVSSTTLTVERGFGGSTKSAQANGSGIVKIAPSYKEFDTYQDTGIVQGETDYNYHQIFMYEIPFSHRAQVIPTYETRGFSAEDRLKWAAQHLSESEVPLNLEQQLVQSTVRQAGSTSNSGFFGGVRTSSFIGTVDTSLAGAPLTPKILLDFIQRMKYTSKGEIGKQIICHPTVARYMYGWFHSMREMDAASTGAVATYTSKIDTPFGVFEIVPVHTWVNPGAAQAVDPLNQILIANLKDYKLTPLSDKSNWKLYYLAEGELQYWGSSARMRGDFTLRATGNPYTRGLLGGFSTTDTDYPAMI
jgi:hypothetical protein